MNYFIKTYGCQMNQSDSSIIEGLLNVAGMQRVEEMNRADLILVNTCSVRAHAEERAQGFVSALKKWKRERHGRVVSVVGCMAQRLGPELKKKFPWIDILVGPDNYQNIAGYVEETLKNGTGFADLELTNELYGGLRPSAYRGVSSYVPIMRGCDNYCSFCVVPYLRGRARSRDSNDILNEINLLVENGVKEVTLLGQNVNAYCTDGIDFADLLERINRVKDLLRIRFLTSHPADMSEKILTAVANLEKVCEYIHLPVQSASNRILNLMNRRYSREKYKEIVEVARRRILNLALSTDVIVGFPTETETDFEATKEFLTEIEFDFAYMFKYSPR